MKSRWFWMFIDPQIYQFCSIKETYERNTLKKHMEDKHERNTWNTWKKHMKETHERNIMKETYGKQAVKQCHECLEVSWCLFYCLVILELHCRSVHLGSKNHGQANLSLYLLTQKVHNSSISYTEYFIFYYHHRQHFKVGWTH